MSHPSRTPAFNHVLAAIPSDDKAYLLPFIQIEHPPQGRILNSRTDPATSVWFPNAGLVALSVTDDSGRSVQTGFIGSEGCVGLEALFGETPAMPDAFVQIEGEMPVIAVTHLRTVLSARPPLNASLLRSAYAISAQAS